MTSTEGTGVVHQAPGFGEDDYRICMANQVFMKSEGVVCPVDESGMFSSEVTDFAGIYVKVEELLYIYIYSPRPKLSAQAEFEPLVPQVAHYTETQCYPIDII